MDNFAKTLYAQSLIPSHHTTHPYKCVVDFPAQFDFLMKVTGWHFPNDIHNICVLCHIRQLSASLLLCGSRISEMRIIKTPKVNVSLMKFIFMKKKIVWLFT